MKKNKFIYLKFHFYKQILSFHIYNTILFVNKVINKNNMQKIKLNGSLR